MVAVDLLYLYLGAPLSRLHACHHCGAEVDTLAMHGFCCCRSQGHHHSLAAMNEIIYRSLNSASVLLALNLLASKFRWKVTGWSHCCPEVWQDQVLALKFTVQDQFGSHLYSTTPVSLQNHGGPGRSLSDGYCLCKHYEDI